MKIWHVIFKIHFNNAEIVQNAAHGAACTTVLSELNNRAHCGTDC